MKEDISCNDVVLHKLDLGDNLSVGFSANHVSFQSTVLPWQLLIIKFSIRVKVELALGNCCFHGFWDVPAYVAIDDKLFGTHRIAHRKGGLFVVCDCSILVRAYSYF